MATTMKNSLTKAETKPMSFSNYVTTDVMKNKIKNMLGGNSATTERFISGIISAVSTNPSLQECEPSTIVSCALIGESLKLSPSPQLGYYYIVPFKDTKNGRVVATFQLGWKSYLQLAMRTGQYKKINAIELKEGELKSYNALDEEIVVELIEDEDERAKKKTIGYYASFELTNGFKKMLYWSREKMEKHAMTYSNAYKYDVNQNKKTSFWSKDFDEMGKKTMLRQLLGKYGIMSTEMQNAYQKDMASSDIDGNVEYVDNQKIQTFVPTEEEIVLDINANDVKQADIVITEDGEIIE